MRTLTIAIGIGLPGLVGLAGCGGAPPATKPALPSAADCRANLVPDDGGNLIVRGRWRDRDVKVLVDTGANNGSIAKPLVDALALPAIGNAKYASASGTFLDTTVHDGGPLSIGGATVSTARFIAQHHHNDSWDLSIGLDQLAPHAMVLDLGRRSFCLVASPHRGATQPLRIAGDASNRDIVVAARFGPVELPNMILDTGAGVITVNREHLTRIPHTERDEIAQSIDGTGAVEELPLVTVSRVCVGDTCANDQVVMPAGDLSELVGHRVDGIIGLPFFTGRVLVLDFPAARIGIE